jgi:hypothetical protein
MERAACCACPGLGPTHPMRATTLLRRVLAVYGSYVQDHQVEPGAVIVAGRPRCELPKCAVCGRPGRRVHDHRVRRWRHHGCIGSK